VRHERLTVLEPIQLSSVMRVNRRLRVVAHDHARRRHVLRVHVRSSEDALAHEFVITEWIRDRTPVAFVRGARYGAFVNVEELFARLT
jgi:hypothetical protein